MAQVCSLARLVLASVISLTGLAQAQSGPVLDQLRAQGKLVLTHRESAVPFSFVDDQKKPVGYALDICCRLAVVSTSNTTPLAALRRLDLERFLKLRILEAEDHQQAVAMV